MANLIFNESLGRIAEFARRVKLNDPAASVLVIDILATAGVEADATLKDKTTFADLVSGATNFVTQASIRKTLTDAAAITYVVDHPNDDVDVDIPDQTWTAVAAGDGWNDLVMGYDPSSTGVTNSVIIPMTLHDFVGTPNGGDITAQIAAAGFFRAV